MKTWPCELPKNAVQVLAGPINHPNDAAGTPKQWRLIEIKPKTYKTSYYVMQDMTGTIRAIGRYIVHKMITG